jgi:anti-sigma regulatory factor (Ser/Thr protein kinase)
MSVETLYCQICVKVTEASQIGQVRREANRLTSLMGFGEKVAGNASIIATEMASNLSRYATGGEILLRNYALGNTEGLEIISIDRGPGMSSVVQCTQDGYSTGGTAGQGLGAIKRLASEFDIFSTQPGGTIVMARIHNKSPGKLLPDSKGCSHMEWGVICLPAPYETECGDTWRIRDDKDGLRVIIADGLGHGPMAAKASLIATDVFMKNEIHPLTEYYPVADRAMRGSRGAAIALAHINSQSNQLTYAGVGNISGSLRLRNTNQGKGLVSHNGTVGVEMRKIQQFEYDCPPESMLIMHSDGLQSRWILNQYPGLSDRHPATIASVLYRDFCRGKDDITVCVIRKSLVAGN